jgi:hypothetical protein
MRPTEFARETGGSASIPKIRLGEAGKIGSTSAIGKTDPADVGLVSSVRRRCLTCMRSDPYILAHFFRKCNEIMGEAAVDR